MKVTHTPGPWEMYLSGHDQLDWSVTDDGYTGRRLPNDAPVIADVAGEANARLIAEAPTMLEALREARDAVAGALNPPDLWGKADRIVADLNAVVAKAEGRA